jgi:hypothetical protein
MTLFSQLAFGNLVCAWKTKWQANTLTACNPSAPSFKQRKKALPCRQSPKNISNTCTGFSFTSRGGTPAQMEP